MELWRYNNLIKHQKESGLKVLILFTNNVKGRPVVDFRKTTTFIYDIRREYSRKPEEFYQMIEKSCFGKKLDCFSRQERNDWYCHGAEVED